MHPIVVYNITQDQFNSYLEQVGRDFGAALPKENEGSYGEAGVAISWKYDPADQTVTLQCTKKPFWLPANAINNHMQAEITKLQNAA